MTTVPAKACTVCGETKPLTDYSANYYTANGRQSACKPCRKEWVKRARAEGRYVTRETTQRRAYNRALSQLREMHIDDFWDLYLAALQEERRAS